MKLRFGEPHRIMEIRSGPDAGESVDGLNDFSSLQEVFFLMSWEIQSSFWVLRSQGSNGAADLQVEAGYYDFFP